MCMAFPQPYKKGPYVIVDETRARCSISNPSRSGPSGGFNQSLARPLGIAY